MHYAISTTTSSEKRLSSVTTVRRRAGIFNYPFPAIEEAVVNAVYHRSYEQREPVEVRVNPDGIEIISYPGPDSSIRLEALSNDKIVARRNRNRRIGAFLKELNLTEGRCTEFQPFGRVMAENGSVLPQDSRRTRGGPIFLRNCRSTRRYRESGDRKTRPMRYKTRPMIRPMRYKMRPMRYKIRYKIRYKTRYKMRYKISASRSEKFC